MTRAVIKSPLVCQEGFFGVFFFRPASHPHRRVKGIVTHYGNGRQNNRSTSPIKSWRGASCRLAENPEAKSSETSASRGCTAVKRGAQTRRARLSGRTELGAAFWQHLTLKFGVLVPSASSHPPGHLSAGAQNAVLCCGASPLPSQAASPPIASSSTALIRKRSF